MIPDIYAKSSSSLRHMILEELTLDVRLLAGNASRGFCEFVSVPQGLSWNTDEAALFHTYQLDASQSNGFELSFTCGAERRYKIPANTTLIVLSRRQDLSLLISFCVSTSLHSFLSTWRSHYWPILFVSRGLTRPCAQSEGGYCLIFWPSSWGITWIFSRLFLLRGGCSRGRSLFGSLCRLSVPLPIIFNQLLLGKRQQEKRSFLLGWRSLLSFFYWQPYASVAAHWAPQSDVW